MPNIHIIGLNVSLIWVEEMDEFFKDLEVKEIETEFLETEKECDDDNYNFKVLHMNICSLNRNFAELEEY